MNNIITKTTRSIVMAALLILAVVASNPPASAQEQSGHQSGHEMKAPQTAQEHRTRAEHYKKKASEYRGEAESHKKMLADYSKGDIKKMRLHCEKYINAAENLAREADDLAKYHEMRAKEVEGK